MTNKIQGWYEEALKVTKEFKVNEITFIIYKGFKITKFSKEKFLLEDVRHDDFYTPLSKEDLTGIEQKGFVKAVDEIRYYLDKGRLDSCTKRIEYLYKKRKKAKKDMSKDVRLNRKRIRLANKNIDILVDRIFLYQTRIEQFEHKYNLR